MIWKNEKQFRESVRLVQLILLISIFILFPVNSIGGERPDSLVQSSFKLQFYPYLFYTPETHLAFGAAAISYFRSPTNVENKLSKIVLSGYYSTRKQYIIILAPEVYFHNEKYFIPGKLQLGNYADKFWGIGNKTPNIPNPDYIIGSASLDFSLQLKIKDNFKAGIVIELKHSKIRDKKENPFLLSNSVRGVNGGMIFGSGISLSIDSRDNMFYPSVGRYYEFEILVFSQMLGSDFDFNLCRLNLREYFSPAKNQILAFQLYGDWSGGYPPFYELPALGEQNTLRGYFLGRYRDKKYVLTQAEYRTTIWWRIGLVGFAGVGDVVNRIDLLQLSSLKYSVGAGLRFALDVKEKLNVRIDFGVGKNSSGIYFAVEEAF